MHRNKLFKSQCKIAESVQAVRATGCRHLLTVLPCVAWLWAVVSGALDWAPSIDTMHQQEGFPCAHNMSMPVHQQGILCCAHKKPMEMHQQTAFLPKYVEIEKHGCGAKKRGLPVCRFIVMGDVAVRTTCPCGSIKLFLAEVQ